MMESTMKRSDIRLNDPTSTTRRQNQEIARRRFDPWQTDLPARDFDPGKIVPGFESLAAARSESQIRQECLREGQKETHQQLADRLAACNRGRPCLSPACSLCVGRFRIWCISQALRFFEDEADLIAVTIINDEHAVPRRHLKTVDARRMGRTLRQQMRRVQLEAPIIGGIDGDYREKTEQWRPHFHLIAPASTRPAFRELNERFYKGKGDSYRPVKISEVGDRAEQVSYCFKGYWRSKSWFFSEGEWREGSGGRLAGYRQRQWLLWRDRFSISDFMFLFGARRYGNEIRCL